MNMDETAVYMNCSPKHPVHVKIENTLSIMILASTSMRFTLAVTIAMDGTKLTLFVIFKGTPVGVLRRVIPDILPDGIVDCGSGKAGWGIGLCAYDMTKYKSRTSLPATEVGLFVRRICTLQISRVENGMTEDNFLLYIIPLHYTGLLQP